MTGMESRHVRVSARTAVAALATGGLVGLTGFAGAAATSDPHHANASTVTSTTNSQLDAVAVTPGSTDVWAVVQTIKTPPFMETYSVAHRHHNTWTRLTVKGKSGSMVELRDIAAASAKQVWVVGDTLATGADVDTPLIERSTGGSFKPVSVKGLSAGAHLSTVAASSPTNAWAMGVRDDGSASVVLHWNGRKWSVSTLKIDGSVFSATAVSVASPHNAWAVGSDASGEVIIHWNGKKWSPSETLPSVESINDIVTTGAHTWAVGDNAGPSGLTPLALVLTSSGWKTASLTDPGTALFQGVAAVGSKAYAVGRTAIQNDTGDETPVFATLSGTKGTVGAMKSIGKYSTTIDVAASTKAVLAVGYYSTGDYCTSPFHALAQQLVHNKWKLQAIPSKVAPASTSGLATCQ
jgi:hypothetical protein